MLPVYPKSQVLGKFLMCIDGDRNTQAVCQVFYDYMRFIVKGTSGVTNLGYGYVVDTRKAHRAFLEEYGKSDRDVPLLIFDPFDWNMPFSPG